MHILTGLVIYVLLPLSGLLCFLRLRNTMRATTTPKPPVIPWFLIFLNYGGLLLTIVTDLFWKWSDWATDGLVYLLLIAPLTMLVIAFLQYKNLRLTRYHRTAFGLAVAYLAIMPVVFLLLLFYGR